MSIISSRVTKLLLLATALVKADHSTPVFKVGPNITVTPHVSNVNGDFPSVVAIRSCGRGAVINWKVEGCSRSKWEPGKCLLHSYNKQIQYKFEFFSVKKFSSVGIGFTFTINGGKAIVYKEKLPNFAGTLASLNAYDVLGSFSFPYFLRGTTVTLGHIVYQVNNDGSYTEEVCGETDFSLS